MIVNFLDNKMKRKGVSNIVGTLFMLAIVVSAGSVILFQGLGGIANFNLSLTPFLGDQKNYDLESIVIEQAHFDPTTNALTINIRNVGSTNVIVDTIEMVKTNAQSLIIDSHSINVPVYIGNIATINTNADLGGGKWSDSQYSTSSYTLSIITIRGHSFKTVVMPFNT